MPGEPRPSWFRGWPRRLRCDLRALVHELALGLAPCRYVVVEIDDDRLVLGG